MNKAKAIIFTVILLGMGYTFFKMRHIAEHDDHQDIEEQLASISDSDHMDDHDHDHEHDEEALKALTAKSNDQSAKLAPQGVTKTNIEEIDDFDYDKELEQVLDLKENYPRSKEKLVEILTKADPFKEHMVDVPPHTSLEQTQSKMGAIKVIALRTILEGEKSQSSLVSTLSDIYEKAKDPTIKAIAKASIESAKQGRDFAKDFVYGVENQELPD